MNIYIANINFKATEDDVRTLFAEFGEVTSCKIITDRETGRSRGFGFVEMPNDNEANKAMDALDDMTYQGRRLVVNEAKPPKKRNRY